MDRLCTKLILIFYSHIIIIVNNYHVYIYEIDIGCIHMDYKVSVNRNVTQLTKLKHFFV